MGGDDVNNGEIIQKGLVDFQKVQTHMLLAKKENATETYASLKIEYLTLKALLNSLGVNIAEIDRIKE